MDQIGRDKIPGELGSNADLLNGQQYLSKVVRGQIGTVNPSDGIVQTNTVGVIGSRNITSPVLWFSATSRTSAWGRYMPMGKEYVHVAYRNDGRAIFAGYDATNTKDGSPGWTTLREFQEAGDIPGFQTFRSLKRGEYDFKSSGDAYIHGSNAGTLMLAGGQAYIKLERNAYRLASRAANYKYESGTNLMRFGTVYRKATPVDIDETAVTPGTYNEFMVDVNQILPGGVSSLQSRAFIHFGDILQDITNTPKLSSKALPLRGIISIGDVSDTIEVFRLEVDAGGNIVWEQKAPIPATTSMTIGLTRLDITGATGEVKIAWTTPSVSVAIANHLQTMYTNLVNQLKSHTHPTGLGPSGVPVNAASFPDWDPRINSNKLTIPDG